MNAWLPPWLVVSGLHFQRPSWLWALLALPLLWLLWRRRQRAGWRDVVDAHLLPHLVEPGRGRAWLRLAGVSLAWALAVLALAGPGWRQEERPHWESRAPLVIALDLSASILTPDLPPTRLAQARAKIAALLREREGGEVGLVAWAEDAYTVAPLTADAGNIALFLDALAPDVMPVDGHRPERGITHAATLLHQAGFERGDILLVTAQADAEARKIAAAVGAQGYRVSVLGLGTAAGATYRDAAGAMQPARLDEAALRALAAAGGGRYATLRVDDADLRALGVLDPAQDAAIERGGGERVWLDQGYWLLLPLLLLAALAFRRGAGVLAALPLAVLLALPGPARAADGEDGHWWRRPDQQAQKTLEHGVDAYRGGDFAAAEKAFAGAGARGAEADYNLGNALARQGRYDDAIAAYDRALARAPGMEDAVANRRVVEAARRQQSQGGQGQSDPKQRNRGQQNQGQQNQGQQNQGQQNQGQQNSDPQHGQGQQDSPGQPSPDSQGRNPENQADPSGPSGQPRDAGGQPQQSPREGQGQPPASSAQPPQAEDAQARQRQAQADREQRERMQKALQQGQGDPNAPASPAAQPEDSQAREQRQAREAWLRRIPDDPGGLLRAKFRLEYERRQQEGQ